MSGFEGCNVLMLIRVTTGPRQPHSHLHTRLCARPAWVSLPKAALGPAIMDPFAFPLWVPTQLLGIFPGKDTCHHVKFGGVTSRDGKPEEAGCPSNSKR